MHDLMALAASARVLLPGDARPLLGGAEDGMVVSESVWNPNAGTRAWGASSQGMGKEDDPPVQARNEKQKSSGDLCPSSASLS